MNSKQKGNAYEQKLARELRELGYKDCVTARSESKTTDDQGIDFVNTGGFAIQAKATERTVPYCRLLQNMEKAQKGIPVIIHKRNRQSETAVMLKEDWYYLMTHLDKIKR